MLSQRNIRSACSKVFMLKAFIFYHRQKSKVNKEQRKLKNVNIWIQSVRILNAYNKYRSAKC